MFDIAWGDKYDLFALSIPLYKSFNFKRIYTAPTFIKSKYLSPFIKKKYL